MTGATWRAQTKPCPYQDPGERSTDLHKRWSQTCLWVSWSLWRRRGLTVACHGVRGSKYNSAGISSLEGGCLYHSLASGQTTGREYNPTHQQKIGSPHSAPPIRKLQQASYHHPLEGRQNENHNHRKLAKLITWITALSNSMKLWARRCRATQDRQVMVESSDKTWSTGEGNGKPLQYSCLESPMNSIKRQKGWRHIYGNTGDIQGSVAWSRAEITAVFQQTGEQRLLALSVRKDGCRSKAGVPEAGRGQQRLLKVGWVTGNSSSTQNIFSLQIQLGVGLPNSLAPYLYNFP